MPDLEYDPHARKRMRQRGITERDVELALRRRRGTPSPGPPGCIWIWGFAEGNRVIKVGVLMADQNYVKTVAEPDQP
jgi:hypothetical protein